ncbi:MAG: neutral/alkaline non-lysosomal ceramidase N-terminal domain-containing protein [Fimbriiglobus sp.]
MFRQSCLMLLLLTTGLQAAELSVGFAETDISPVLGKKPVYMAGFGTNRIATKIHDPIMARAVVLEDEQSKIAFVSVDLVGVFRENVEAIRKKLKGFRYVLVSSTHNHEGPDTLGLWGRSPFTSGVDPDYLKQVEEGCVAAIQAADKKRQPATAKIGTAKDANLIRDARQPVVKHDEIVTLEFFEPDTTKRLGLLVQWNCHPELLDDKNTEISADHVHYTVKHLEKKLACPVAYFTGTVGGLMTALKLDLKNADGIALKDGTFEKTQAYGEAVAELALKATAKSQPVKLTPFIGANQTIMMPVENNLYRIAKQAGVLNRPMYLVSEGNRWVETKDASQPVGIKTEVGYIVMGDLEIAAIPGEIYPELVLGQIQDPADPGADFPEAKMEPAIYANLKGKHRMIFGLANDQLGYFIPKRQWDEKAPYCYKLKSSQYGEINSVGPNAAGVICETFRDLVRAIPARK